MICRDLRNHCRVLRKLNPKIYWMDLEKIKTDKFLILSSDFHLAPTGKSWNYTGLLLTLPRWVTFRFVGLPRPGSHVTEIIFRDSKKFWWWFQWNVASNFGRHFIQGSTAMYTLMSWGTWAQVSLMKSSTSIFWTAEVERSIYVFYIHIGVFPRLSENLSFD